MAGAICRMARADTKQVTVVGIALVGVSILLVAALVNLARSSENNVRIYVLGAIGFAIAALIIIVGFATNRFKLARHSRDIMGGNSQKSRDHPSRKVGLLIAAGAGIGFFHEQIPDSILSILLGFFVAVMLFLAYVVVVLSRRRVFDTGDLKP